jgi:hypothetical protein
LAGEEQVRETTPESPQATPPGSVWDVKYFDESAVK